MSEAVYGPIISFICAVGFGWLLVRGFRTGSMKFPQPSFTMSGRRSDQPVRFWLTAMFIGFLTLASAIATIGQLIFPRGL
ncbi:hypothetical protein G432_03825 [Sphingomonas sp. MM-1]|nr:hypothetical protein G432_03825 [Sphingomonas sp. MM-1]